MPIDSSSFSASLSTAPSKEDALAQTSAAKAVLLSDIASQKREKMMAPVNEALNKAFATADAEIAGNPAYHATQIEETRAEGFVRGLKEGVMSIPGSAIGIAAIGAATAESAFGEGGLATDMKHRAVDAYVKFQQHMSKDAQPEDSFTYSYQQAQEGNLGALVSWTTHGVGYVTSQLMAILTGAGIIGKGVELVGKRAIAGAVGSLVEKEAAKLASANGLKVATEAMVKQATSDVTKMVAQRIGTGVLTTELSGGEIGGDLAEQSVERGTPLTGRELGRGAVATAAASATEYAGTILGLKGLQGKLGKVPGAGVNTANINGLAGRAARGIATTAKVAPAEMTQEFVQTGFEIWGTGKDPRDREHWPELIDGAALGGLSGPVVGAGSTLRRSNREKKAAEIKAAGKRLVRSEAQPGFTEKVRGAVEAGNADQYMDPSNKKEFDPIAGTKALRVLNQDENTSPEDKHAHYNKAVYTYNHLKSRQLAFLDRAADPKDPTTREQAEAAIKILGDIQKGMLPEIQAMGTTGTTSPVLKKLLAEANDDASVEKAIAQILGSRSGGQDLGSSISLDAITNNPVIGTDTKKLVQQIQSLEDSKNILSEHNTKTQKIYKSTNQVTENIFAGTDGQKGIHDYVAAIQVATDAKNTTNAQKELNQLAEFARAKQTRATTFRNYLEGTQTGVDEQNMALYNKERLVRKQKPYTVGPNFKNTIKAMELEADALTKAVTLGSTISKLTPKISPTRDAAPSTVVETPGQEQSAVPSAPTSKMSPTPFAQKVVTSEVGDSSSARTKTKMSTVTEPASGKEELATTPATVAATETGKTLEEMTVNELRVAYRKTTSPKIKEKIASIARAKKAGTFVQTNNTPDASDASAPSGVSSQAQTKTEVSSKSTPDRRRDAVTRKTVDEMTPEEMRTALLTSYLTGLKNKRAFEEDEAKNQQVKVFFDVDGLKFINDEMGGHEAGDVLLKAVGQALLETTEDSYHLSGDEFVLRAATEVEAHRLAELARENLKKKVVTYTVNGKTYTYSPEVSYGVGQEINVADQRMVADKTKREQAGLRSERGTKPVGLVEVVTEGRETGSEVKPASNQALVTPRDATDTNPVRTTFTATRNKSYFHRTANFLKSLPAIITQGKETEGNSDRVNLLSDIMGFTQEFTVAAEANFKPKQNEEYHREDPLNWLADQGVLPEIVTSGAGAVTYKWLATRASKTEINDEKDARGILGLASDHVLLDGTMTLIKNIGTSSAALSESLGKDILKVIGVKAGKKSQAQVQERVEIALGFMALATLQKMGYLERINVSSAAMEKLVAANKKNDLKFTMTQQEFRAKERETSAKYFRIIPSEKTKAIREAYSKSKGTWDVLFTGTKDKGEYSWQPFVLNSSDTQAEMRKSQEKASIERTQKLNKNVNQPIQLAPQVINVFESLNQETKEAILGVESTKGLHVENVDGVESNNRALKQQQQQLQDWLHNASKQAAGLKSPFRIPAWIGTNTRMYQEGSINMLMNKASHRYMFAMQEWNGTFDFTNEKMVNYFLEAIGQSLKIESSKDSNFQESVRTTLETPVMVEALAAIDVILKQLPDASNFNQEITAKIAGTLTPEQMAAIAKGVKEGKLAMHTLKGLVEYQRFVNALKAGDKTFTTDISFGMDGLASGPTISFTQLTLTEMTPIQLGIMQSAGFSFTDEVSPTQHAATYDPYQAIGGVWGNQLALMENDLAEQIREGGTQRSRDNALLKLRQIKAATDLLGPLTREDGALAEITRKLSKDGSVPALYGAGLDALLNALLDTFVKKGIHKKLESLAASDSVLARQEFIDFRNNVRLVTGDANWGQIANKKDLPSLKVTPEMKIELRAYITKYHGQALFTGIETVYADSRAASKPLNQAVAIGAAYYNTAFDMLLAEHFKTHKEITVGKLAAIKDKLRPLFPRVKTYHGDYIEVAEFEQSKDYDPASLQNIKQSYNDPRIFPLTGRPHKINKLANPGVSPIVTTTHMLDASIMIEALGNTFGAGVLAAHDNAMVGLHQIEPMNELMNHSFYKIMSDYSMAEALQASLLETEAAFVKLDLPKGPELTAAIKKNFAEMKLKVVVQTAPGKFSKITDPAGVLRENKRAVAKVVEKTNKNKEQLLGAATWANQYFVFGLGSKTGNTQQESIGSVPVVDIIPMALEGVQALAASNVQLTNVVKATLKEIDQELGSRLEPMSTNPLDYAIQQTIDSANVVDVYDGIKHNSTVIDTPAHDTYLKGVLNTLVVNVMAPLDLLQRTVLDDETHGQLDTKEKKLYLASQAASPVPVSGALANGIRMSTGEVYVHELVHAVTNAGLQANKYLRRQTQKLFDIAEKELNKNGEGFRAFLNDPTIDIKDPANHYDVQAAKDRFDYIFGGKSVTKRVYTDSIVKTDHTEELSHHLDEFVALGLTNANFLKALQGVSLVKEKQRLMAKSTWAGILGDNLQDTIVNIFGKLLEILHENIDRGIRANNVGAELQRMAKLLTKIDSKNKTKFYNLTQAGLRRYGKIAGMANHMIKEAFKTMPVVKTIHGFKTGMEVAMESKTLLGESLRNIKFKVDKMDYGLIKSVVTEMQGHTPRMDWIHSLQHRRKTFLDAAKTAEIASTMDVANSTFHRPMTSSEKVTFLKVGVKTDLSVFVDQVPMTKIASLIGSKTTQQKEIDKILKEIQANEALAPYKVYYQQMADALGYHMVHGRSRQGEHVLFSPKAIGHLTNSTLHKGKLTPEQGEAATALVDKLATLYALKYTSAQHLTTFSGLIAEDSEGITRLLRLHNELKQNSLKYAFKGNPFKMIKGYTKEIMDPRIDYQLGTLADAAEMQKLGYTRSDRPIERDPNDPTKYIDIYAYTADTNRVNDYLSQTASMTNNKAKGTNTQRLAQQMDESSKTGAKHAQTLLKTKQAEHDAMFFPHKKPLKPEGNPMIAQVDDNGVITDYRYMMSENTKDDYLGKTNEFDKVMGAMAGQTLDKARTPVINEELVDGLLAMYEGEYHNNPEAYVEVSPHSSNPKLREIYYMLPDKTKHYIQEKWGSSRMFVAKDVLTIAFGYRKYSMVQAFAKTPAERHLVEKAVVEVANMVFRSHGLKAVNNIEQVLTYLTGLAKNNLVVKSLYITLSNFGSNMVHLKALGVPLQEIITGNFEALREGLKYQKDKQLLAQLTTKQKLTKDPLEIKKTELQISRLKDALARNPVTRFIEAGGLPTLVDDFETDLTQDNYPGRVVQFVGKVADKLPTPLVNVGKVLFLTHDTGAYKLLNNAVKMTDFTARYTLYKYRMRQAAAEPGFKGDQAAIDEAHSRIMLEVLEEFVNFNLPTHKTLEYLNNIGLVWFSRYVLRVQKVILKSIVNRPFDAAVAMSTAAFLGFDQILNSLLGINRSFLGPFDNAINVYEQNATEIITLTSMKDLLNI